MLRVLYASMIRGDQLIDHRAVHDQPTQGRAALTGRAGGGEDDAAQGEVEVGVRRDDAAVVAAEFEQGATEPGRDQRGDLPAHPHRAGR